MPTFIRVQRRTTSSHKYLFIYNWITNIPTKEHVPQLHTWSESIKLFQKMNRGNY